jgi:predicted heme/steroid binding protein
MQDFTADELAKYDGKGGQPTYVAFKGVVYDVSESGMWDEGDHEGLHTAGHDLTAEHDDAPHDILVTDFPQVGRLV